MISNIKTSMDIATEINDSKIIKILNRHFKEEEEKEVLEKEEEFEEEE